MGYWINKVVWFLSNPLDVGIVLIAVGIWLTWHRSCSAFWARLGRWMARAGVIIILLLSLPITAHVLGYGLERNYEEHDPKDTPEGEVVLDLAGSWQRAWYAAELVKAKRAKWLITSGVGVDRLDAKLIRDLGVKEPALILDVDARNTEENVKNAKKVFAERCLPCDQSPATSHQSPVTNHQPKVLVVTTAVHMPRSMLLMRKYWPEVQAIPAPTEFMVKRKDSKGICWDSFVPSLCALECNLAFYHEYLGYMAYRWLKR